MSIKTSSQNLSGNNTVGTSAGAANGAAIVYDNLTYDPYYNRVGTHFSDTDYTNNIMQDLSGNNWQEFYGATTYARSDARIPVFNGPRYRDWCSRFDGDGGYYNYTDAPHLRFGYQDFTIEFWIKPMRNHATQHYIMAKGGGAGTAAGSGWVVGITAAYKLIFGVGLTTTTYTCTTTLLRDTWYHVAIQRTSLAANGLKVYINGVAEVTTGQAAGYYNETGTFKVGRDRDLTAGTQYGGNITDIRIQTGGLLSTATATAATANTITVASTAGFVVNQRVVFSGTTLTSSNIVIGTVYYIRTIESPTTFTISASAGPGAVFILGTASAGGPMVANVLTYTASVVPTLPTAALDMSGQYVVYAASMLYPWHPDVNGDLTRADIITRRIDSPFINNAALLTGHGSHAISIQDNNGGIKIYDTQTGNASLRLGDVFTVEAWVYCSSNSGNYQRSIFGKGTSGWTFQFEGSGYIQWYDNATTLTSTDTRTRVHKSGWYHVAAVREGTGTNQFKMYVNGLLAYTGTLATSYATDTTFAALFSDRTIAGTIGHYGGFMTGIKWSNGTAQYTATSQTALVTDTAVSGLLTISTASTNTSILKLGMPITFTGTAVGGLTLNSTYYVYSIPTTNTFMVTATRGGAPATATASSGGTTMFVTLTPSFDVTPVSFIDTLFTTSTSTALLVGSVGTGTVVSNSNSIIDRGTGRFGGGWRKGNELRHAQGSVPGSRHGYSAWYPSSAQHQMKAFVNASNPNDFTFGTNDFSIEMWLCAYDAEQSYTQIRTILDTRLNWNDTGIRIRRNAMFGIDVLTSGKIVLSSPRNVSQEAYSSNDGNIMSTGPSQFTHLMTHDWYHICVQRVSNKLAMYINGRRVAETYYTTAINAPASRIILGNSLFSTSNMNYDLGWYGWMSDVRICNGNSAYAIGLTENPDTIPVPVAPLKTTTNCVLLTFCHSTVADYSGRANRVGFEQTLSNGASTWEVKNSINTPYSGVDYNTATQIQSLGGTGDLSTCGFATNGSQILRDQTNNFTEYSFITRMSSAWTIEFFFYNGQSGTNVRATPSVNDIVYTANSLNQEGFQINVNQINGATATFGELQMIFRTANSPVTQYLQTSGALAANGGEGYWKPYSWVHAAFVYDPSQATPMAIFINGVRVATRAAFTAGLTNWNTYALNMYIPVSNFRISNVARYSAGATTYTVPTAKHVYDANTVTLFDMVPSGIVDKTFKAQGYSYSVAPSYVIKKFGNASMRIGQGPENLTADQIHRFECLLNGLVSSETNSFRGGDFTIELWASWRNAAMNGMPFSTTGSGNFLITYLGNISVGVSSTGYWKFQHVPSHTDAQHWIYNVGPGVNTQTPNTATGFGYQLFQSNILVAQASLATPNAFDHIVVMRRQGNIFWYINGVEMAAMYATGSGSYGAASNTLYAPINDLAYWDTSSSQWKVGGDDSYTKTSLWCGWVQDVRLTSIARYETKVINNVPTMVYKNTKIPALPTAPFPTK